MSCKFQVFGCIVLIFPDLPLFFESQYLYISYHLQKCFPTKQFNAGAVAMQIR